MDVTHGYGSVTFIIYVMACMVSYYLQRRIAAQIWTQDPEWAKELKLREPTIRRRGQPFRLGSAILKLDRRLFDSSKRTTVYASCLAGWIAHLYILGLLASFFIAWLWHLFQSWRLGVS